MKTFLYPLKINLKLNQCFCLTFSVAVRIDIVHVVESGDYSRSLIPRCDTRAVG